MVFAKNHLPTGLLIIIIVLKGGNMYKTLFG